MGSDRIELSIIITSFMRDDLLEYGLMSLSKQKIRSPFEIVVINDGIVDTTESVCNKYKNILPIRYIFTGQRNINGLKWRVASIPINIGIKQSIGKNIIITCAEIVHLDVNCVQEMIDALNSSKKIAIFTDGRDDEKSVFLDYVKQYKDFDSDLYDTLPTLDTTLPFFMGLNRQSVIDIGGYDEDFVKGYAYDDAEFTRRLRQNNFGFIKLNKRIVHLYHPRNSNRPGIVNINPLLNYSEKLYNERDGRLVANSGKDWGKI